MSPAHWLWRARSGCARLPTVSRSRIAPFVLAALFTAAAAEAGPTDGPHGSTPTASEEFSLHVPGAAELEGRIIAPCCWNQTIDIHGSPSSNELRREVRRRLREGESKDSILTSIVDRYGQKILAVPTGSKLGSTGVFLAVAMGVAGVGAISLLRRWQKRTIDEMPKEDSDPERKKALDARIDAELARLDTD